MNYSLVQIYDKFRDISNNLQLNTRETQLVINVRIFAIRHLSVGKRKNASFTKVHRIPSGN
jgi:hypothetical protein